MRDRRIDGSVSDGRRPFPLWSALGCGVLLGAAIAVLEFTYYRPLAPTKLGSTSLAAAFLTWGGEGALLALAVALVERRKSLALLDAWRVASMVVVGALAAVAIWQAFIQFILRDRFGVPMFLDYLGEPVKWTGTLLYHLWLVLVFGGLATGAYFSWKRQARMLAVLRDAELSRERSQRELVEAKLATLRARIDPALLFQRMTTLERLYESEPAAADRLLDELIAYLRREE